MNLLDGERLLLTIDRKVTVECDVCKGCGTRPFVEGPLPGDRRTCCYCNGTGQVERRLRGVTIINEDIYGLSDGIGIRYQVTMDIPGNQPWQWTGDSFHDAREKARADITAAYLANELPAEIAGNLELTEEATDAE